ncbi:MAG: hypothetical protein FJ386_00800 [Verrucomicrobia bacterium]|nr:hypothetical protein [Verrucomicrobiota bacterium]
MGLPQTAVTLSPENIAELSQKLGDMRHNINNQLSLIIAAVELCRRKPEALERMLASMEKQPGKVMAEMRTFTAEFEGALGIKRDEETLVG